MELLLSLLQETALRRYFTAAALLTIISRFTASSKICISHKISIKLMPYGALPRYAVY